MLDQGLLRQYELSEDVIQLLNELDALEFAVETEVGGSTAMVSKEVIWTVPKLLTLHRRTVPTNYEPDSRKSKPNQDQNVFQSCKEVHEFASLAHPQGISRQGVSVEGRITMV